MKLAGPFVGFLLLLTLPSPALPAPGDDAPAVVRISSSFPRLRRIAADGRVWLCEGDTCRGRVPTAAADQARACYGLGRRVDHILSFEAGGSALSEEALRRCNGGR